MSAKPINSQIREMAVRIIEENPEGIRFSELQRQIHQRNNSFKLNSIGKTIYNIENQVDRIEKPIRGLYRIKILDQTDKSEASSTGPKEEDFYGPFVDYLKNDLEDVTKAIPLGGSRFGDKWGTPDVIGKRASRPGDIVEAPTEIVAAEIKTNTNQLITAFGQACAYCLFSHRSYLVVPKQARPEEISRLDSLCQVFGLGFVLFDSTAPDDPDFDIRVRPKKQDPDIYYTNLYMQNEKVRSELFG